MDEQNHIKIMRLQKLLYYAIGLLLFIVFPGCVWAQHTYTGRVLDRSTGKPLTGAHVHLLDGDVTTTTNANGEYTFTSQSKSITLRITYVGYRPKTAELTADNISERPAVIFMQKSREAMSPVTVLARKTSSQPDQFLDANSTVNLSHDAGQFLKDSPNISGIRKGGGFGVDPVLRGFQKNQLMVEMDGLLQSQGACPNRMDPPTTHIQMEQIEEVEILKGPYALKHGPSFGGIINFKSQQPNHFSNPALSSYVTVGYESNIDR
ncbi:MAG: carboxypeptidase-like regulatory domain-containing protein, partial [Balneolaceae bacterium]|nr:carboxypeptidase-like regulatory domain-containing protein [Balneolaceae bacterium]